MYLNNKFHPHLQYLQGLRVLVVDSNHDFSQMMTVLLQLYGVEVLTASLSQQALEIFVLWEPDIILSDLAMLHKDGYRLIQQLITKAEKLGKMVIAIAVTDYGNKEMFQQDLCLGFNIKFTKPLDLDDFLTMLSSLVICQQSSYVAAQQILGIKPLLASALPNCGNEVFA